MVLPAFSSDAYYTIKASSSVAAAVICGKSLPQFPAESLGKDARQMQALMKVYVLGWLKGDLYLPVSVAMWLPQGHHCWAIRSCWMLTAI